MGVASSKNSIYPTFSSPHTRLGVSRLSLRESWRLRFLSSRHQSLGV
nr:MAG TPA: hypothetical protein [Caudoviricetes sp.]